MKKIFSILVTLVIAVIINNAGAQDNSLALNSAGFKNIYLYDNENSTAKDAAVISMRALRDFAKTFKNVAGEKWYKVSDGFMASFTDNGIETKVAYEITHDADPVYIFKIEDSTTLKMLRVAGGEIEVITDNTKG